MEKEWMEIGIGISLELETGVPRLQTPVFLSLSLFLFNFLLPFPSISTYPLINQLVLSIVLAVYFGFVFKIDLINLKFVWFDSIFYLILSLTKYFEELFF